MSSIVKRLNDQFNDKKVLIVGLGLLGAGVGLVRFFSELGAQVRVTDLKKENDLLESLTALEGVVFGKTFGVHKDEDFLWADIIFKGPSVPWNLPQLIKAKEHGIPIEMEMSFFASHSPAKIIGVTGTRGKSTTTKMIFEVLRKSGNNVYIGGNMSGVSTINLLKRVTDKSIVVLELSSWALSGFHKKKLSPHIAVFTNFYPDHLNYYQSQDDYLRDKKAIYLYQSEQDFLVINKSISHVLKQDNIKGRIMEFAESDFKYDFINLKGQHNKENAAAALAVANILGVDSALARDVLRNFAGLPARLEVIAQKGNITVINDSTSTTPTSAIKAIEALGDKFLFIILGGESKNLPVKELVQALSKVEKIFLTPGTFSEQISVELQKLYPQKFIECSDITEAFSEALKHSHADKDTYILFSPGATSFGQFKNEFDRSDKFKKIVTKMLQ